MAFVLLGCALTGGTVYAVSLRVAPDASHQTAGLLGSQESGDALESILLLEEPPFRHQWGRLELVAEEQPPAPLVISVPPMRIVASPPPDQDRPRKRRPRAPIEGNGILSAPVADDMPQGVMAQFKASPTPTAEESLPHVPVRQQISDVMGSIRTSVQTCYDRGMVPGRVVLTITVEGSSGRVTHADVSATSSTAQCIQRLARTLRFPRFAKEQMVIQYPYSFR
jgi:hypothetical protein